MRKPPLVHAPWTNKRVRHFVFGDRGITSQEVRSFTEENLEVYATEASGGAVVSDALESLALPLGDVDENRTPRPCGRWRRWV